MAFDKKGAYWLGESKTIRNPYFGGKMIDCGGIYRDAKLLEVIDI